MKSVYTVLARFIFDRLVLAFLIGSVGLSPAAYSQTVDCQGTISSWKYDRNYAEYAIRSETLVKQGSFADGLVEIRKAINEAPYIAQFYYNAAIINAEMKQHREAIRDMKVYLAAAPDSPHARAAKDEIIKWELAIERGK